MITLGIETSCDETAVALVEDGKVLSSEISSSVHLHSQYGGVVPEIASRFHTEYISSVFDKALEDAGKKAETIDLVAVTSGPGLPGSLLVGMAFAKAVSYARGIPIIGVGHLAAHILSCFIREGRELRIDDIFPFVGMVTSGGHTSIYDCRSLKEFRVIGRTRDDAVGEAFDKVAKMLDLGYPGGPVVEERAAASDGVGSIRLPRPLMKESDGLDFSFSGIKTAVMYRYKDSDKSEQEKNRICSAFQESVTEVIVEKAMRALRSTGAGALAVGGGVINNSFLRKALVSRCADEGKELFLPEKEYCADNAAMIAVLGERLFGLGEVSDLSFKASLGG